MIESMDFSGVKALLDVGGLGINAALLWALWKLDRRILKLEIALAAVKGSG